MSHTPPVPEANQSPYPLSPAPHPEVGGVAIVASEAVDTQEADEDAEMGGRSLTLIGSAVAGVGAVVAAAAWFLSRRKAPAPKRRTTRARKTPAKRGTATRSRAKKAA